MLFLLQVNHASDVWVLGKAEPQSYDAMVTNQTGVVLGAPGADCMPILFADPVSKVIAAAHAGLCHLFTDNIRHLETIVLLAVEFERNNCNLDYFPSLVLRLERDPVGGCYGNSRDHGEGVWLL